MPMLLKEIKDRILKIVYDSAEHTQLSIDDFAKEIPEATEEQLVKAGYSLNQSSMFATYIPYIGGRFTVIGLSAKGTEYVEEYLLSKQEKLIDSLSDTDKSVKSGTKFEIDLGEEDNLLSSEEKENIDEKKDIPFFTYSWELFKPTINSDIQKDADVNPCFGVNTLATCFVRLIDSISRSNSVNVSMLGIFAPWGRGKTYFFSRVKDILNNRKDALKYFVISFNAWKYQETPAIWAYLYETLKKELLCWGSRLAFNVWRNSLKLLWSFFIFACPFAITWLFREKLPSDSELLVGLLSVTGFILKTIYDNFDSAQYLGRKIFFGKSFDKALGTQSEIEKELEALLRFKICRPEKKKVLLYVDDIDRCDYSRITSVIESLRTIIENPEIGKRLVVVCSIDVNILKSALAQKYGSTVEKSGSSLERIVRDQIDKLFVSSISLPQLKKLDYSEYLQELSGERSIEISGTTMTVRSKDSLSIGEQPKSVLSDEPTTNLDIKRLIELILEEVPTVCATLTPRQVRILYYRCLFAMNILSEKGEYIDRRCIHDIIRKSYSDNEVVSGGDDIYNYNEIVSIVVPL